MAEITRYVLVNRDDVEQVYEYEQYQEAVDAAGPDHAVVERHYEYSDSELVWTPNRSPTWPPKPRRVTPRRVRR